MMKYLPLIRVVCLCILLQTGCRQVPQSGNISQDQTDSLEASAEESSVQNDPWVKYSYIERQGKRVFEQYCAICHGVSGEGDGFNAYNLNPRPHSLADSAYMSSFSGEILTEIITYGGKGVNKSILMPAYQNTLSKTQIADVTAYIGTFTSGGSKQ